MGEKEQGDTEATFLISSTSEDCEGTFTVKVDNVALPGPSASDTSPSPRRTLSVSNLLRHYTAAWQTAGSLSLTRLAPFPRS